MSFPSSGKVLFTATLVRGHIAKFHLPYLKWFKDQGWETWVAAKNDCLDEYCSIPYCDHFVDICFARSPFSAQTYEAYGQLRDLFAAERFDIVHTHTPVGSVLTRFAARRSRRNGTKVIYTAHGFHFYKGAPLLNWILWYPVERLTSRFADVLVAINEEDFLCARRFARCKVIHIPGVGVELARFSPDKRSADIRSTLGFSDEISVLLTIGDLNKNKNQGVLVKALAMLPSNFRLVIVGDGPMDVALSSLARRFGVEDRVSFLGFRSDIDVLLASCDLFCIPSKREGLPVSLIEAMSSGVLCLASSARGCPDVLGDLADECVVEESTPQAWASSVMNLSAYAQDRDIENRLLLRSRIFSLDEILPRYEYLYHSLFEDCEQCGSN